MNIETSEASGSFTKTNGQIRLWFCGTNAKPYAANRMARLSRYRGNKRKNWGKSRPGVTKNLQSVICN